MRNCMFASAAKENGAEFVALVEPDLHSAQDRGPRTRNHPQALDFTLVKFVGQPALQNSTHGC